MRKYSPPVQADLRQQIIELADQLIELAPKLKLHHGRDLAMNDEDMVVSEVARFMFGEEVGQLSIARSKPEARPPFEWIYEITSDLNVDNTDYLKHYLIRDDDIVLAQRKILTEVDDEEAKLIIRDLEEAVAIQQES